MRRIGTLTDAGQARRFSDYLLTLSIQCSVDIVEALAESGETETQCDLWIRDEADVDQARKELQAFHSDPDAAKYQVESDAEKLRKEAEAEDKRRKSFQQKVKHRPASGGGLLAGLSIKQQAIPVVIAVIASLILLVVIITFLKWMMIIWGILRFLRHGV
ncbi:MAG: hypothetical protein AAFV88_20430 [Planctomycetota bacterium]